MWIAVGAAAAVLLLVLVLATPLELRFSVRADPDLRYDLALVWMFGLIGKDLRKAAAAKHPPSPAGTVAETRRRRPGGSRAVRILSIVGSEKTRGNLLRFLKRERRAFRPQDLVMRLRFGLDDPCETGMAYGVLFSPLALLARIPGLNLDAEADFESEDFEFLCRGRIRTAPWRILWPLGALVLSPPVLRALIAAVRKS